MTDWMVKDWKLKVVSLVLAVGLWTYAMSEEGVEIKRTVPLQIKLKNPHMSILDISAKNLQVTLVANRAMLSELTSENIVAVHEIGEDVKTAGEYQFKIEPSEIRVPDPQIHVSRIDPDVIRVTLDELIVKKLPVKPNFTGDPAFGYKVVQDEIQMDPNAVLIEGPKAQLEKLDRVLTEKIDLIGRIRSFRRTLAIYLPENVKSTTEDLIDAYIPIREEFEEKALKDVAYKIFASADRIVSVSAEPSKISFVLKGSKRQLDKLSGENILAYIDTSKLDFGEHKIPVVVMLPEDVTLKDAPPVVKITIKKK